MTSHRDTTRDTPHAALVLDISLSVILLAIFVTAFALVAAGY
ncbi:hypothetical protein [Methylobacterium sp. A54F]